MSLSMVHKDMNMSSVEKFEFFVFSFSDENLKYIHDFIKDYPLYVNDDKKISKIMKTRIYGNSFENEFLNLESLNQKKYIDHFKLKMTLILNKMKKDEENLKNGVKIEPSKVIKGNKLK